MNAETFADDIYIDTSLAFADLQLFAGIIVLSLPLSVVIGFAFGTWRRNLAQRKGQKKDLFVGETTVGAFLALLGLLLAFTFGNALTHNFERKSAIADEAAALGTAFMYSDLLPEPQSVALKKALLEYTRTRVLPEATSLRSNDEVTEYLAQTLEAQSKLWPIARQTFNPSIVVDVSTLIATSVSDVLAAHVHRMSSLPAPVSFFATWTTIGSAAVALFLLGNRAALQGREMSWRTFVFCAFLVAIILIILDTQRATEGFIRLDQGALYSTIVRMEQSINDASVVAN